MSFTLTPNVPSPTVLEVYDDGGEFGIRTLRGALQLPITSFEETYSTGPSTEGGRKTRSRADNPTGQCRILIDHDNETDFWNDVRLVQKTLEQLRTYGGYATSTPPGGGTPVAYDIESAYVTEWPHEGLKLAQYTTEAAFDFVCRPFGRLAAANVHTNTTEVSTPLDTVTIPALSGSTDALGEALFKTNSANSHSMAYLEWGLESRHFNPAAPWPLLIDSNDMTVLESATKTTTGISGAWGASQIDQAAVSTTQKGIASVTSTHVGRFRLKARVWSDNTGVASVRGAYSVRGGALTFLPWKVIPTNAAWWEIDLGLVKADPLVEGAGHDITFNIYGKRTTGTDNILLDYTKLFPAERYGKIRAYPAGTPNAVQFGTIGRLTHNGYFRESAAGSNMYQRHPNVVGSYLKIPVKGGRLAYHCNDTDLDAAAMNSDFISTDTFKLYSLNVTPRVVLLG